MDEIFENWEDSLLFDTSIRRRYAENFEERSGWATLRFQESILQLCERNRRTIEKTPISVFQPSPDDIAEVVQQCITNPFKIDTKLHLENLTQNRQWLLRWLKEGWYQKWLGDIAPDALSNVINDIEALTGNSLEAIKRGDIWAGLNYAEQSVEAIHWPPHWALRYIFAVKNYLAELFAPKNYAWKTIQYPEKFQLNNHEMDRSKDYLFISAAIEDTPDQNRYNLPDSLKGQPLITVGLGSSYGILLPCGIGQISECREAFCERSLAETRIEPQNSLVLEETPSGELVMQNLRPVRDLTDVRQYYQEMWRVWLSCQLYIFDGGNDFDWYRRSTIPLADRWSLLVDRMPQDLRLLDEPSLYITP